MKIRRSVLDEILAHSARAYPEEACGFLVGTLAEIDERAERAKSDGEGGRTADRAIVEAIPIANAAEKMRRERPDEFTRGSADGYVMDPKEQLRAENDVRERGLEIAGTYHSHVDVGAYFSEEDAARALMFGEPMFTTYVVTDARKDGAKSAKAFVWNAAAREFLEAPLEIV